MSSERPPARSWAQRIAAMLGGSPRPSLPATYDEPTRAIVNSIAELHRYQRETYGGTGLLDGAIVTDNPRLRAEMTELEQVATTTNDAVLITGATGTGKTALARGLYDLKRSIRLVTGEFVEVNGAVLLYDAQSTLFGHRAGAYTGAQQDRMGLMAEADGGVLFLDEVGDLGLPQQGQLLRAWETKCFRPLGSNEWVSSDVMLICATHKDLAAMVAAGTFRRDLYARISGWVYRLPSLVERPEDLDRTLDIILGVLSRELGWAGTITPEARAVFLRFALSPDALWPNNFRDFQQAVRRMLVRVGAGSPIDVEHVEVEKAYLTRAWAEQGLFAAPAIAAPSPLLVPASLAAASPGVEDDLLIAEWVAPEVRRMIGLADRGMLALHLRVCLQPSTITDATRVLYAATGAPGIDTGRLRRYLAKYGLTFEDLQSKKKK